MNNRDLFRAAEKAGNMMYKKRKNKKWMIAMAVILIVIAGIFIYKNYPQLLIPNVLNNQEEKVYSTSSKYDRSFFEGNKYACGKTETFRERQIIVQGEGKVEYTTAKDGCADKITGGVTYDPYNGEWVDATSSLELDHVVPLAYAWLHGADKWDKQKAYDFAHNTKCYSDDAISCAMIVTTKSANAGKGARGLDEWLPKANKEAYIETFNNVLKDWGLK